MAYPRKAPTSIGMPWISRSAAEFRADHQRFRKQRLLSRSAEWCAPGARRCCAGIASYCWRRDGEQLYYVNMRNTMNSVEIHEKGDGLEIGHPVPLFTFRPSPRVYRLGLINYDVSPDGKRFLLVEAADENNRPLTLLEN
jgi:hypothetical protein